MTARTIFTGVLPASMSNIMRQTSPTFLHRLLAYHLFNPFTEKGFFVPFNGSHSSR